jgi:hypothetical protein
VPLPKWLTEDDIDYYTGEFTRAGYRGGLNWYRTPKLNWELMAAWHNAPLVPPSLYAKRNHPVSAKGPGRNWGTCLVPRSWSPFSVRPEGSPNSLTVAG